MTVSEKKNLDPALILASNGIDATDDDHRRVNEVIDAWTGCDGRLSVIALGQLAKLLATVRNETRVCGAILETDDWRNPQSTCSLYLGHDPKVGHYDPETRTTWTASSTGDEARSKFVAEREALLNIVREIAMVRRLNRTLSITRREWSAIVKAHKAFTGEKDE